MAQNEDWEKRLEIAMLKSQLKELSGEEELVQMAVPQEQADAFSQLSADKTIMLQNGLMISPRTLSIMRDPKPEWAPQKNLRYIVCVDEIKGNESEPAASKIGSPHKIGGHLATDKAETPEGWINKPATGTAFETVKAEHPLLYKALVEKAKEAKVPEVFQ